MAGWGLTVLRVAVGLVFVAHGAQTLFGLFGGPGLASTAARYEQLDLPAAYPLAVASGVVQFGGGLMVFLGAWTRWAAIALAAGTAAAVWAGHLAHGFFLNWALTPGLGHGYEFHFVLIGSCVCLALAGAGELSIDNLLDRSAESALAGRQRIRSM
ncbi:MAG TPA: DoxX family protein [Vicinamibacterales bacterium]